MSDYFKLAGSILLCLSAGFIGSFFTASSIQTWYADLEKPSFNPPNWVFAPVWTLLYVLMGVSLYLVWMRDPVRKALFLFAAQLLLNASWSVVFFGFRDIKAAFAVILFLGLAIAFTIKEFAKISKKASTLLLPYQLWVTYAAILNYAILTLNA